LNQAVLDPNVP